MKRTSIGLAFSAALLLTAPAFAAGSGLPSGGQGGAPSPGSAQQALQQALLARSQTAFANAQKLQQTAQARFEAQLSRITTFAPSFSAPSVP